MSSQAEVKLSAFEKKISYKFNDKSLLELSLTHPSFHEHDKSKPTNQRLEFLGDSVLSLVLTTELYKQFPEADEGELTQFRASLIRGESLAEMAKYIGLQDFIYLSPSEKNNNGHMRSSTLEDAIEALIGAIYLDRGIESARQVVLNLVKELWGHLDRNISRHNPKGQLQEWVQENLPNTKIKYKIICESGPDHAKHFDAEIFLDHKSYGQGSGSSKKEAESNAAQIAIKFLKDQVSDQG